MQPAGRLDPPPAWMTAAPTRAVLRALAADGGTARFVGGCVRDAILRRDSRDIDIAIDRPPDAVQKLLTAAGIRAIPTGIDHGTVTAVTDGAHFEITTLRRDVETFGRRARVAFTDDWAADAARRDFTINALYADGDGTLYDPTGGRADLAVGRVRFVGVAAQRIAEDALRLLRFFRFYAYYGRGPADPEALAACAAAAPLLEGLSGERLAAELLRLLLAPDAAPERVLRLMADQGVLRHLLPVAGDFQRLHRLCEIEQMLGEADSLRRLAALLSGGKDTAAALAARLRLSAADAVRLQDLTEVLPDLTPGLPPPAVRRLLYRYGRQRLRDLTLLAWAATSDGAADRTGWLGLLKTIEQWDEPRLPVRGADALALGVRPGPAVGGLLAAVERWWVDADFRPGRDEALARLRQLVKEPDSGGR